jgi:hypothetical protein
MTDRCCTLCAHNPVFIRPRPTRLQRAWGWLLWKLFRKPYWWLPAYNEVACKDYARIFCYDVRGSQSCEYHARTTRPEFLACKSCPAFELKHKVDPAEEGKA